MIKFRGELSQECKTFIIKRQKNISTIICLIISVVFSTPFIIFSFMYNWIFLLAVLAILTFPLCQLFSFKGSTLDLILPNLIEITDQRLESIGKNFKTKRLTYQINKILDYGDWYQIYFKFPYRSQHYVLQKNLIVEGTIEEFEQLFADKIIRKY